MNLEWWQTLGGIIILLGFSAGPWIAALLAGKLITAGVHNGRIADKDAEIVRIEKRHDATVGRLLEERNYERTAKDLERGRADALADKLGEATIELGETAVHLLRALPSSGGDKQ